MLVDAQIAAHLRQQTAANFFLSIFEGGEFFAEVQTPMATLTFVANELAVDIRAPRRSSNAALEFRTLHSFSLGQICPNVKPKPATPAR